MYQDNLMPSAILTLILGERETSEHLLKVHSCSAACNKSTRSTSPERGPKSPSSVSFAIEFLGNRLQVMSILKHILIFLRQCCHRQIHGKSKIFCDVVRTFRVQHAPQRRTDLGSCIVYDKFKAISADEPNLAFWKGQSVRERRVRAHVIVDQSKIYLKIYYTPRLARFLCLLGKLAVSSISLCKGGEGS